MGINLNIVTNKSTTESRKPYDLNKTEVIVNPIKKRQKVPSRAKKPLDKNALFDLLSAFWLARAVILSPSYSYYLYYLYFIYNFFT